MAIFKLWRLSKLEKDLIRLQEENNRLRESQKRCIECENFNKKRSLTEDQEK